MRHAACRGAETDVFFPDPKTLMYIEKIAQAQAICAGCEVRHACLNYALETKERDGIWGGLTRRQRAALLTSSRALLDVRQGETGTEEEGGRPNGLAPHEAATDS